MIMTLEPLYATKELIFSRISEEQIFEFYGIPVTKGLFKSPLREDHNPTCSYYRDKNNRLILKDFSGAFSGDAIAVVMFKFKCSFYMALQIIANDFDIIHRPDFVKNKQKLEFSNTEIKEQNRAIIQVQIRDYQPYELDWWKQYGITEDTLHKFSVYSCKNVFLNGNMFYVEKDHQLVFGYFGGIKDEIEQWRIYFPGKKKFKFISNWRSNQIQGSDRLLELKNDYLVITKSMKDVMCLYEYRISAIAPTSENLFVTDVQYQKLKKHFNKIFLLYDNDLPGINAAVKIHKQYPDLQVLIIPRKYEAKDISDFRKKYGLKKTQDLLNEAKKYYSCK